MCPPSKPLNECNPGKEPVIAMLFLNSCPLGNLDVNWIWFDAEIEADIIEAKFVFITVIKFFEVSLTDEPLSTNLFENVSAGIEPVLLANSANEPDWTMNLMLVDKSLPVIATKFECDIEAETVKEAD